MRRWRIRHEYVRAGRVGVRATEFRTFRLLAYARLWMHAFWHMGPFDAMELQEGCTSRRLSL